MRQKGCGEQKPQESFCLFLCPDRGPTEKGLGELGYMDSMLSVGIDIGTSTTSMVVTRLRVQNTASSFSVPRVAITGAEVIYRGRIRSTPQAGGNRIDADQIAGFLEEEYRRAGITPEQVQTGAVIITGESARKENAALVTRRMSRLAGDFVVATAGPDLESVIAAKGAGTAQYTEEHACEALNLDVGGGTTNMALFRCGSLKARGCWDIGGRLVQVEQGRISRVSPAGLAVADSMDMALRPGEAADRTKLRRLTDRMAEVLSEAVGFLPKTPLCDALETQNAARLRLDRPPERISFSGGVASYIYQPTEDWFRHGDVGPLLADSIRRSPLFTHSHVVPAKETIRATVLGAGAYTTTVSGSTIDCEHAERLPLRNLPAFVPGELAEQEAMMGQGAALQKEAQWFLRESGGENLIFCLGRTRQPSYRQVCALADGLVQASEALPAQAPLVVLTEQDYAKVLGQALRRRLGGRGVICIDGLRAEPGDYLDLGRPLLGGVTLPVVVKTLIFG